MGPGMGPNCPALVGIAWHRPPRELPTDLHRCRCEHRPSRSGTPAVRLLIHRVRRSGAARLPGLRDTESLLQSTGQCRRGLDTLAELATDRFRLTRANGSEPQMPRALTLADDVDDLAVVVETREVR